MAKVNLNEIREVFNRILEKLEYENVTVIEFDYDLYRYIPTDQWNNFSDDNVETGSLDDDIESLILLSHDKKRPCTYVDFDRMASLLRAISERNNPAKN